MNNERYSKHEKQRMEAYQLLAAHYYLPEQDAREKFFTLKLLLEKLCLEAAAPLSQLNGNADIDNLKIDFSRLFVGPFKLLAPPYGSVYLEGGRRVMGDSTIDVRSWYREAGLDISKGFKDAHDHIAVELEFMYFLIHKELEALDVSDFEGTLSYLNRQEAFLARHLGAWVKSFAGEVEKNADTDFYRSLAMTTRVFIRKDIQMISEVSIPPIKSLVASGWE